MIENQESISIPVAYLEAFVMMFVAFLIGYIGATMYARFLAKKRKERTDMKIEAMKSEIARLKEENEKIPEDFFRKDRMDQEYEQVQFQKRAFSEHVLTETAPTTPTEINFDRIGRVKKEDRDDLQEIVGIGPYTEAKLNNLGIYTYEQISKFNDEDIAIVTELIKFFPDRIKNDRWVAKANDLKFRASQGLDDEDETSKKKITNEKTT